MYWRFHYDELGKGKNRSKKGPIFSSIIAEKIMMMMVEYEKSEGK